VEDNPFRVKSDRYSFARPRQFEWSSVLANDCFWVLILYKAALQLYLQLQKFYGMHNQIAESMLITL
jgi:hypothetical protein